LTNFNLYYIIIFLTTLTVVFIFFSNHPIEIALWLIFFTALTAIYSYYASSPWIAFTLVLIFLGGIIVIFRYVAALSNREKLSNSKKRIFLIAVFLITFSFSLESVINKKLLSIKQLYFRANMSLVFLLGVVILVVLILVSSYRENFKGALIKIK